MNWLAAAACTLDDENTHIYVTINAARKKEAIYTTTTLTAAATTSSKWVRWINKNRY